MDKHPYFDLLMHDTAEMERIINGLLYARVTLHEWPLSCVQRVVHYDARRYIYKSQREPTVEPEFYATAHSSLLVNARLLLRDEQYACLLLEHLEPPRLDDLQLSQAEKLSLVDDLLEEIANIRGKFPVYIDIRSKAKWSKLVKETVVLLNSLVDQGIFQNTSREAVAGLAAVARSPAVMDLYDAPTGLVHGDLRSENIFVLPGDNSLRMRLRLLDWQRPLLAPPAVDRATLLESLGLDPLPRAGAGAVCMRDFLLARWCAECASRWYPPASPTYDRTVAEISEILVHLVL